MFGKSFRTLLVPIISYYVHNRFGRFSYSPVFFLTFPPKMKIKRNKNKCFQLTTTNMFIFYGLFHSFLRCDTIFLKPQFFYSCCKKKFYTKSFKNCRWLRPQATSAPPPQHGYAAAYIYSSMVNANEAQIWLSVSWPWRLLLQRIRKCKQSQGWNDYCIANAQSLLILICGFQESLW